MNKLTLHIKFIIIIIILSLISCNEDKNIIKLKDYNPIGLSDFLKNKGISIDEKCGVIDTIKIDIGNKTINTKLFISCNFYTGSLNLNPNKVYNSDNILTIHNNKHLKYNNKIIDLNQLDSIIRTDNLNELYIFRDNWNCSNDIKQLLNKLSNYSHLQITFNYRNKQFYKSIKFSN